MAYSAACMPAIGESCRTVPPSFPLSLPTYLLISLPTYSACLRTGAHAGFEVKASCTSRDFLSLTQGNNACRARAARMQGTWRIWGPCAPPQRDPASAAGSLYLSLALHPPPPSLSIQSVEPKSEQESSSSYPFWSNILSPAIFILAARAAQLCLPSSGQHAPGLGRGGG